MFTYGSKIAIFLIPGCAIILFLVAILIVLLFDSLKERAKHANKGKDPLVP